jgi:hypothetical protein
VSPTIFVLFLALGAAIVALWIELRFPALAPVTLRASLVHAAVAFLALVAVPVAFDPMLAVGDSPIVVLVALFGGVFPVLVYAFLTLTWLVKPLARGLPGG